MVDTLPPHTPYPRWEVTGTATEGYITINVMQSGNIDVKQEYKLGDNTLLKTLQAISTYVKQEPSTDMDTSSDHSTPSAAATHSSAQSTATEFSVEEINRSSLGLFGKILHQIRIRLVKVKEVNSREEKRMESPGKPNNSQQITTTQGFVLSEGSQEPTMKKENDESDAVARVTASYDSDTDIEGFTNETETVKTEDEANTDSEELQQAGGSISAEELKQEEQPKVGSINRNVESGLRMARSILRGSGRHKCTFCNKRFKSAYNLNVHIQHHLNKKEFKCTQCEKAFNTRSLLQTHLKVHLGIKKHACEICGKKFLRLYDARRHADVHNSTRGFHCKKCDRWFKSQDTLTIHEKWQHSEAAGKKFACDTCGKTFSRNANLTRHVAIHLNKKEFQCTICAKRFNHKDTLRMHMKSHNPANGTPTKKHTCEICGRKFNRKDILTRHTASCLNIRAFKCPLCGEGFNSNTAVKSHLLVHDEGKNYTCEICGRAFKRRGGLRDHVKTHLNEKSHKCKICGKGFNTSSAMSMHVKMHVETKDYSCEICGKVYKWKHALRDHKVTHSEEKRYQCAVCNKSFHTGAKLTSHKAYCSTGMECPVCHEAIIGGKRQLQKHMKIHPFTCEICGKVFTRKELLKRHNEIHLNERKYVCELCDKAYNTNSQLCTHKNRVHKIGSGGTPITSSQEVLYRL